VTGGRLSRRLVATHLLVVAASLSVLAVGAAAGLPTPAAAAAAVAAGVVLGAVLALRTGRWISGPLQDVSGALFTSLSGADDTFHSRRTSSAVAKSAQRSRKLSLRADNCSISFPRFKTTRLMASVSSFIAIRPPGDLAGTPTRPSSLSTPTLRARIAFFP